MPGYCPGMDRRIKHSFTPQENVALQRAIKHSRVLTESRPARFFADAGANDPFWSGIVTQDAFLERGRTHTHIRAEVICLADRPDPKIKRHIAVDVGLPPSSMISEPRHTLRLGFVGRGLGSHLLHHRQIRAAAPKS